MDSLIALYIFIIYYYHIFHLDGCHDPCDSSMILHRPRLQLQLLTHTLSLSLPPSALFTQRVSSKYSPACLLPASLLLILTLSLPLSLPHPSPTSASSSLSNPCLLDPSRISGLVCWYLCLPACLVYLLFISRLTSAIYHHSAHSR